MIRHKSAHTFDQHPVFFEGTFIGTLLLEEGNWITTDGSPFSNIDKAVAHERKQYRTTLCNQLGF